MGLRLLAQGDAIRTRTHGRQAADVNQASLGAGHGFEKILSRGHVARIVVGGVKRLGDPGQMKHQIHAIEGQVEAVAGNQISQDGLSSLRRQMAGCAAARTARTDQASNHRAFRH